VLSIKQISDSLSITQNAIDITTKNSGTTDTYNILKFECCINNGIIFLLVPRKYSSSTLEYYDIYYMDDTNTALETGTASISISYRSTDTNLNFAFTSPSAKYITHFIPSIDGYYPIQYIKSIKTYDTGIRISYYKWLLGSYSENEHTSSEIFPSYGTPIDGGIFGYAVSKNCTLILPTFIFNSAYGTACHFIFSSTSTSIELNRAYSLPYVNPSSNIKCKTLVTPSCIDYENDIFYCVGYDGGIYKIHVQWAEDTISVELLNSTWINYAQHINFEFTAIKFHTQYKADGTKQLYMFIVGEEGSYVAPINDITTFGPDAVFTEIPNLQAKDVLTGNVLTDAAFVNRLLIINDKNNNDIMFYEQSLPEIDKPGVNAFIKIKN